VNVSAVVYVKSMLMNCADLDDVTETALEPRVTSPVVVPTSGKFDMRCRRPRGLPTPTCWSVSQSHRHRAPHSHCVTITPHPITKRSIVMTVSVCLSASISPELQSDLTDFCACYLHMYVRGLVLLWRRRDTLCTSGLWMTSYLRIQARSSLTWPPS